MVSGKVLQESSIITKTKSCIVTSLISPGSCRYEPVCLSLIKAEFFFNVYYRVDWHFLAVVTGKLSLARNP